MLFHMSYTHPLSYTYQIVPNSPFGIFIEIALY